MSANTVNRASVMPEADGRLVVIERPIPSPGPSEVLVRNHAVAVNPFDWKRQAMNYKIPSFPVVFGSGKQHLNFCVAKELILLIRHQWHHRERWFTCRQVQNWRSRDWVR